MHSKTSAVYITGTDTDAGKTIFCAHLLSFLRAKGINAVSQKWAQTGWGEYDDAAVHAKISETAPPDSLDLIVPQRFKYPASPQLAARLEGKSVDIDKIKTSLAELTNRYELVLCEGSGGALVPLTGNLLISDLAAQFGLPAIVVCANKLGCINHALLTVEALRSRGIDILGIAFTRVSQPGNDDIIEADNIDAVRAFSGETVLGEIPWLENPDRRNACFDSLGENFLKRWEDFRFAPAKALKK
jgi:dethiobiotin synthetase